ncbi:MAG: hypothetical protein ACRD3T_08600, partial [Terriglobia bacterium]
PRPGRNQALEAGSPHAPLYAIGRQQIQVHLIVGKGIRASSDCFRKQIPLLAPHGVSRRATREIAMIQVMTGEWRKSDAKLWRET